MTATVWFISGIDQMCDNAETDPYNNLLMRFGDGTTLVVNNSQWSHYWNHGKEA